MIPKSLKTTLIRPLLKKTGLDSLKNYHSVSNLTLILKVIEKVISGRLKFKKQYHVRSDKPTSGQSRSIIPLMELNLSPYQNNKRPPYPSLNHKASPPHTTTPNPTSKIDLVSNRRANLPGGIFLLPHRTSCPPIPVKTPSQSQILFRSNECNKAAHVRHAVSPKQIDTHHESSMTISANQLNLVNLVQTPMYSFMLLNIARLFTNSKSKFKVLHDLCSCSTLFLGLCETFLFDGINDCEIHIPDFAVIQCDRFSSPCVIAYFFSLFHMELSQNLGRELLLFRFTSLAIKLSQVIIVRFP